VTLLDEVFAAHGGREAWESATEVTARVRSGGFALAAKGAGGPFRDYEARISMREPRTIVTPYPGGRGVFEGDSVRLETSTGELVERRDAMRGRFPGLRRRFRWDALDALYFAGYALWNYFTTPLFLTRAELEEDGRCLRATFPDDVPTHSRRQTFRFDDDGLLTRLDYTAEVFGKWARAKHVCTGHREFDGLIFPTSRRVTPRRLPVPTLVWIETDEVSVLRDG
jgi:hypothetical protein